MAAPSYIEVPASEVRRRVAETIKWYEEGGRAKLEADLTVQQRNVYREMLKGKTHGIIHKRLWTDEETEAEVDKMMNGTSAYDDSWVNGISNVKLRLDTYDGYVKEMRNLAEAATGDYPVNVRTFLWQMIATHSTDLVATEPTS